MGRLTQNKFLSESEDAHLDRLIKEYVNQDTLILKMLRLYGMRGGELLQVRAMDINEGARTITVHGTKGSNDRTLPLPMDLLEVLVPMAKACLEPTENIFKTTRRRLFDIWYLYRPCMKPLHSLRHTCGINLYKRTRDIHMVNYVLGHANINNTMIYLQFVASQADLSQALLGNSPDNESAP